LIFEGTRTIELDGRRENSDTW